MRIVIVGAVAGGAACAARLRRLSEDAEIIMVEKGSYISFASCGLPYYLSGVIPERGDLLVSSVQKMQQLFNIQVLTETEVTAINRHSRTLTLKQASGESSLDYDVLILSPGCEPLMPAFARGLKHVFTLRSIPDADGIMQELTAHGARRILVAGGGLIGLECAENLRQRGLEVTLLEGAGQVLPPLDFEMAQFVHLELRAQGIDLRLNTMLQNLTAAGQQIRADLGDRSELFDAVILALGGRPRSQLALGCGLECSERGFINLKSGLFVV